MNPGNRQNVGGKIRQPILLDGCDRWQVYRRLQELDIACWCDCHQPLSIEVGRIDEMVQTWCVIRQATASRRELIAWLNRCWLV